MPKLNLMLVCFLMFQRAFCAYCHDRIWGLGRQGFKCTQCKLLIHKKCHKLIRVGCDVRQVRELERELESSHGRSSSGPSAPVDFLRPGNGATTEVIDDSNEVSPIEPSAGGAEGSGEGGDSKAISLDDFDLIRVIGRGSYAKVLMVELKKTKRIYAMKVIKKELVTDDEVR